MSKKVTPKEVADQVAIALELLLRWFEQTRENNIQKPERSDRPLRKLNESSMLKAKEVGKILGVSESYAYRLMHTNKLPAIHIGRSLRIRKGDLDKAIEEMKQSKDSD